MHQSSMSGLGEREGQLQTRRQAGGNHTGGLHLDGAANQHKSHIEGGDSLSYLASPKFCFQWPTALAGGTRLCQAVQPWTRLQGKERKEAQKSEG